MDPELGSEEGRAAAGRAGDDQVGTAYRRVRLPMGRKVDHVLPPESRGCQGTTGHDAPAPKRLRMTSHRLEFAIRLISRLRGGTLDPLHVAADLPSRELVCRPRAGVMLI